MFRNYFTTAWRNLLRNKAYSALNIFGLAIGMAVALLIGLWVSYQYSYDHIPEYTQVYQAHIGFTRNGQRDQMSSTCIPMAGVLKKEIPEIAYAAHADWSNSHGLRAGENKVFLTGLQASEDFFHIFPYTAVDGDLNTALNETYSIILTASTAKSLFGNENAMNKTVRVDNEHDVTVTAIIKDLPDNSSSDFKYVLPFNYMIQSRTWVREAVNTWDNNSFQTFVKLRPGVSYAQIVPKLKPIYDKYDPAAKPFKAEIFMQPMKDWHLYSDFKDGQVSGGFIDYVRLFSLIGVLVLLIACINFMNLSTARSEKRAKEVGVRKAIGSLRKDLILQFLVESFVITLAAGILALLLVELVLPAFNTLTKCAIAIPWNNPIFWMIMLAYILGTGLLAGSRPAFYLSSFQPVKVLKGLISGGGRAAAIPRKVLVVLQFTCSIALIISTLLIYQQIRYAKDRPKGFDSDRLIFTDGSADLDRNFPALKDELLRSGTVASVTRSSSPVTNLWNWSIIQDWSGRYPDESLSMANVDIADDYFKTVGMQFVAGGNFSGNYAADSAYVVLNEAAVKRLRFKDPINQVITWQLVHKLKVIGVVKDALMQSPFEAATPVFFLYHPDGAVNITYRLAPGADVHQAIGRLTSIFNKYNPAVPYLYDFVDETYANKFQLEVMVGRLAALFAGLAIFISCLGLFGLAAYTAEQRTREIGIRKVLGATVSQLWLLLSKDFIVLVGISCMVSAPIAFYFLHSWLQKYEYRITIGPGVFLMAAAMALLITILTISFQAIRGATANPTKSLRSE
jgi:ABC-type antimicrobial peptide transport system permease subunit